MHRGDPSPVLRWDLPVAEWLDPERSGALQQNLRQLQAGWEVRVANKTLGETLPPSKGLYMFVWSPPFCFPMEGGNHYIPACFLYVGKADRTTLAGRYKSEYSKLVAESVQPLFDGSRPRNRMGRLKTYLALERLEYWFLPLPDSAPIAKLEKNLIQFLNPPINAQHKLRQGKTSRAF